MEAVRQAAGMSVEDYLAAEERSEVRHEYLGGAVYAMAGASDEHIALSMNLAFALRHDLQNSPCRVQMSDGRIRLRLAGEDVFYYPDVMVVCDPRDRDRYFKRFPKVVIEVLSESTEAIDRREKFLSYRQIETLEDYVLVAQDKMDVTGFARANGWQPVILRRPDEVLRLASLDFSISLRAIYDRVAALP
ncbi:MAG TPA: Uma2 family endonuclease [Dongiaceae bacterium]|nr:Uma2 family endonuclease [Dongiaceae bacterium]